MRILLDTHTLLWWLDGDARLPAKVREVIGDPKNEILVSAASAIEITTKFRIGKLPGAAAVAADVAQSVASQAFLPLSISLVHAERAGRLPGPHRDPFDRLLAAQCQSEDLPVVSADAVFDTYGVTRLW